MTIKECVCVNDSVNITNNTIYIVQSTDVYDDVWGVDAVFADKHAAEDYCRVQNEIQGDCPSYYFNIISAKLKDTSWVTDQKVVPYYSFYINYDDVQSVQQCESYNDDSIENRIYDNDITITDNGDCIIAYSIHSYNEAKQLAKQYYNKTYKDLYNEIIK